ncbi:Endonuclease/exonuclease/phosphatase [Zopfochytrium polystomum]|nr:Endonuclease/exonuclease/phosphatase [Zopfochytrium polystomum]
MQMVQVPRWRFRANGRSHNELNIESKLIKKACSPIASVRIESCRGTRITVDGAASTAKLEAVECSNLKFTLKHAVEGIQLGRSSNVSVAMNTADFTPITFKECYIVTVDLLDAPSAPKEPYATSLDPNESQIERAIRFMAGSLHCFRVPPGRIVRKPPLESLKSKRLHGFVCKEGGWAEWLMGRLLGNSSNSWHPALESPGESAVLPLSSAPIASSRGSTTLSIVTYNVWFEALHQSARASHLLNLVLSRDTAGQLPDIICLQEVTHTFLDVLCAHPVVRALYWLSDDHAGRQSCCVRAFYGVVVLVRRDRWLLRSCVDVELPSRMGRGIVAVEVAAIRSARSESLAGDASVDEVGNEEELVVRCATAHFESMDHAPARDVQRQLAKDVIEAAAGNHGGLWATTPGADGVTAGRTLSIICGDFNITQDEEEDAPERLGLVDAWTVASSRDDGRGEVATMTDGSSGYTVGVNYPSKKFAPRRMDRVVHLPLDALTVERVAYLGRDAIAGLSGRLGDGDPVYPSDHIGLRVWYTL